MEIILDHMESLRPAYLREDVELNFRVVAGGGGGGGMVMVRQYYPPPPTVPVPPPQQVSSLQWSLSHLSQWLLTETLLPTQSTQEG